MSSRKLERQLTSSQHSLKYLFDSNINSLKTSKPVHLTTTSSVDPIIKSSQLISGKPQIIPLLIFNHWKRDFNFSLGQTEIKENVVGFVKTSLVNEFSRSGVCVVDTIGTTSPNDVVLTVEIEKMEAQGPYAINGFFAYFIIMYVSNAEERAGPGKSVSTLKYTLTRGNSVLLQRSVQSEKSLDMLMNRYYSKSKLRSSYAANLAEGISLSLKDNMEKIVRDVGDYLAKETESMN